MRRVQTRGGQKKVDFYLRLRAMGIFPEDAPHSIRAFGLAGGRLTIEAAGRPLPHPVPTDPRPARRLPAGATAVPGLRQHGRHLARRWPACSGPASRQSPRHRPLRLPPAVIRTWKDDLGTVERTTIPRAGERIKVSTAAERERRTDARPGALPRHRAMGRRGPGPLGAMGRALPDQRRRDPEAKERKHRKARMDQRTRERLPVLPVLVRTANQRPPQPPASQAADRPRPASHRRHRREAAKSYRSQSHRATRLGRGHATGKRRNLSYEEEEAFWAFATIEVLRLTGIRCEELLELTHHSITEYRLPSTGEAGAAAADRTVQDRHRTTAAGQPRARRRPQRHRPAPAQTRTAPSRWWPSYDVRERIWNPPMPLLFQRGIGNDAAPSRRTAIRKLLINALAATGLTDAERRPTALLSPTTSAGSSSPTPS